MSLPGLLPDISIESTDKPEVCKLACFPATGDPISPGIRLQIAEFSTEDGLPCGLHQASSTGPILCANRELVEIRWIDKRNNTIVGERIHWIDPADPTIRLIMREIRSPDGKGCIEDMDVTCPMTIRVGDSWISTDRYIRGDREAIETFRQTVDGPFVVTIGRQSVVCVRLSTQSDTLPDQSISESFIACESGRVLCSRTLVNTASIRNAMPGVTSSHCAVRNGYICLAWRIATWTNT